MKSLFLSVVLALLSSAAFSQANAVFFKDEKGAFVKQEQSAVASFELHMTIDELAMVQHSFALYDHIQFTTNKLSEGVYACKLTVLDTTEEYYFAKLFASVGIDHALIGERSVPLQDLPAELTRLKM